MHTGENRGTGVMIKTYNIKLFPEKETYDALHGILTEASAAYNACAEIIRRDNVPLDIRKVHEAVYHPLRGQFPSLPAQTIIKTYKDVISAFRSLKKNGHEDKTPRKTNPSLHLDKRLYGNLSKEGIYVSGVVKNHRTFIPFKPYPQVERMFDTYTLHDPLLFIKDGQLYISLPFECPALPVTGKHVTGVDMGLKRLFMTSDGVAFRDKEYLAERRRVRYLKRCLKGKNTKSARRHLHKLSHKERNVSKDMLHRSSNALLANCGDVIVFEKLKEIKKNTSRTSQGYKRKRHNNRMSQVPIAEFIKIVSYKAPLLGKEVATVNPANTSRIDSRSGSKDGDRMGCRYYCVDGTVLDADWNAAVNIAKRCNKHPFSSTTAPLDGAVKVFLDGRGTSTSQSCRKSAVCGHTSH